MNSVEPPADDPVSASINIEVFGKYYLIDRIAIGGMGEIFRAVHFGVGGFENHVAIKRIAAPPASDDRFTRMFVDEAKVFSVLQAANIVRMYDFGRVGDHYFIAMECVDGKDVRFLMANLANRRMILPISFAVYIALEVAKGLDYAHDRTSIDGEPLNIVHRDINPSNILLSYTGEVKVGDFGIVRAVNCVEKTDVGAITGKLGYMSPEQTQGVHLDRRSDIFTIGVLLHEMLTGRRLFKGVSEIDTLDRIRRVDVVLPSTLNPEVSPELERVVMRSLARDAEDRYQTAREMQADLLEVLHPDTSDLIQRGLAQFMQEVFREEQQTQRARAVAGSIAARRMHRGTVHGNRHPEVGYSLLPAAPPRVTAEGVTIVPAYVAPVEPPAHLPTAAPIRPLAPSQPKSGVVRSWWTRLFAKKKTTKAVYFPPPMPMPGEPRTAARALFVESPAPWDGAESAREEDIGAVRVQLTERLHVLRESAPTRNDWLFIDRLVRACSAPLLDFPLFPTGARRLEWLLRSGDIDQIQVVEVVVREPGMLKRVWDEANSAAFGSTPPANVREAVMRLGHRRLWQIAMSASMSAKLFHARDHQEHANHLREVSIVAADASAVFDPSGDAYLPALLHGLGKLVVYRCGPAGKPQDSASPEYVGSVADRVYPSVGMLLADAWKLGPGAATSIGFAPTPERSPREHHLAALATRAGCIAAHESWALNQGRTFDGFVALTALGFPNQLAARALDASEAAWRAARRVTN
ncbi:MAG: serine/threonine protein kinase [Myxococcales bacterium]|nr:serine/threonine protein kinase [Myxococcales bacterium]